MTFVERHLSYCLKPEFGRGVVAKAPNFSCRRGELREFCVETILLGIEDAGF